MAKGISTESSSIIRTKFSDMAEGARCFDTITVTNRYKKPSAMISNPSILLLLEEILQPNGEKESVRQELKKMGFHDKIIDSFMNVRGQLQESQELLSLLDKKYNV